MKTKWIATLLYLVSLTCAAGATDLIGQRYQDFQRDFPEFKELSGSCLLGCKYSIDSVKDLSTEERLIILSKKTQGSKRWEIVDVLESPQGRAAVSNCTENYSSFKQMQATTPGVMPSSDNFVALISSASEKDQDNKLWLKATQVFAVDTESHTFTEISNDDVYCYVGIG